MANIEEGIPFEPWTAFRIASVSKAFTSLAILQLQEKGKLQVQDPVSKYLPNVKFGDKFTIHQLMTHTSGLQRDLPYRASRGPNEVLWEELESNIYLLMEPGDTFSYTNVGYVILGQLIEKISGQTYEDYMQEHIFKPLGMNRTFSESYDHISVEDQAEGYESSDSPVSFEKLPPGQGGISSTVEDLYLWDQALYTNKLVSYDTLETIFTNYIRSGEQYGYGWFIDNSLMGIYYHDGLLPGFSSYLLRDTGKHHTVIILSNQRLRIEYLYNNTKAGLIINKMLTEESLK
ncbi:putative penicillin-binding protein PbpX [compost metagenome]